MKKESIYIAGPMCFYEDGYPQWYLMRDLAKVRGFDVALPNDVQLDFDPVDLHKNGDAIFENCENCMNASTAIICNLEFYRGADVDGGSIYEVGMAYAKGCLCYGYTRDKRAMVWKYQGGELRDGVLYDRKGRPLPYGNLPFSPNVIGSLKIVEGDFDDCLRTFAVDCEERRKTAGIPQAAETPKGRTLPDVGRPVVYLAGHERYAPDAAERYAAMKAVCDEAGFYAVVPTDSAAGVPEYHGDDPYAQAYHTFLRQQQHVRDCDILVADLNDFHGWEPDSDTSFECGMAFQLGGKKLYGYMDDTRRMIERVPNLGPDREYRDACGCNAENFDYPLNIMFASSMTIVQGGYREALQRVRQDLGL